MFRTLKPLVLASGSPRRREFLQELRIEFTVMTSEIDETPMRNEPPARFAERMALAKAAAVARTCPGRWVLAADTVVALPDGTILGKPADPDDALAMLRRLAGSIHLVMTGLCLCHLEQGVEETRLATTEVRFAEVSTKVLRAYVDTGEPLDKAGAYGIQGRGGILVDSIHGSCSNVIGLPLHATVSLLLDHDIIVPARND
ncbi:MAG: Maf family nucleotide pyrophosphatase [Desulfobulbaceae bacterium]